MFKKLSVFALSAALLAASAGALAAKSGSDVGSETGITSPNYDSNLNGFNVSCQEHPVKCDLPPRST